MSSKSTITLDHEQNILYDRVNSGLKNLHALYYIPEGLYFLAQKIRNEENKKLKTSEAFSALTREPVLIANIFSWFSSSLVSYLRLVALVKLCNKKGWNSNDVAQNREEVKKACKDYVESVIPEILAWRNKIAAHLAITDPWHDDNIATLEFSAMNAVVYMRPYYKIGIKWGTQDQQSDVPEWALTESFEKLTPRFWPNRQVPILDYK